MGEGYIKISPGPEVSKYKVIEGLETNMTPDDKHLCTHTSFLEFDLYRIQLEKWRCSRRRDLELESIRVV